MMSCLLTYNNVSMPRTPEKNRENSRRWRAAHPEKARAASLKSGLAWRAANPEKAKEQARRSAKKWRAENPEKARQNTKTWRAKHPEYARAQGLKRRYGITLAQYTELLGAQNDCCAIRALPAIVGAPTLCVDHDHATLAVRGLLCRTCNVLLGNARDNVELLRRAALYLERTRIPRR